MSSLEGMFEPTGALAERLPGFTYRSTQRQMAELVWTALAERHHLAVEAGTGIGKTFAYLVPVLLSGRRAIISTGTLTLQDQLFARDLPMLGAVTGRPVEVALLKGRSNYLCRHRLDLARRDGGRETRGLAALETIAAWARSSSSGDLTELDDLAADSVLRGAVTSTIENCLGTRCESYERCFLVEARRRAQAAQVVIVNHHLLLADLALKESGFGELLPGADAVIVDEAHQLPDIAQQFFGISLSSRELQLLARDVIGEARAAGCAGELEPLSDHLSRVAAEARLDAGQRSGRIPWHAAPDVLRQVAGQWRASLERLHGALEARREVSAGLGRCADRARDGLARLDVLDAGEPGEGLRWFEVQPRSVAAHWTPLDTGRTLGEHIGAQSGTWIFTSATLAVGDDFGHFLDRIGVEAVTEVLPSPFDYARNACLYVPEGLPQPDRDDYVEHLLAAVWPLVEAAEGGAFLLFTSYRALHAAHAWLEERPLPGPLLVQGEGSRTELLTRFREAGDAVLLGTSSFWQGVDVRGPALRVVVIDKLPFASPGDPLVQARVEAIRKRRGDPFAEFQLPQAVLALKQGVGRLIRDFEDRGLIVIGDPRLRTRGYGRIFLSSLPPMRPVEALSDALAFASRLAPRRAARQPIAAP